MRSRRGFTLVELLVVIGIIALLIGILLPSLSKARATARQMKCLSNIRQLGIADQLYQAEYKSFHIPGYWGWSAAGSGWDPSTPPNPPADGPRMYWFQVVTLTSMLKSDNPDQGRYPSKTCCPEAILSEKNANVYGWTLHESYGMNYTQLPGMNTTLAPTYWNCWRGSAVLNSAEKVFFADSTSEGLSVGTGVTTPNSTLRYLATNYGGEDWSGEKHQAPHFGAAVAYRHKGRANVLFFDGHAVSMSYDDLKYDARTDPSTSKSLTRWQPTVRE